MLRAVIIEDELKSRETLRGLLNRFCDDVLICAEASGVETGKEAIEEHHPDLIFLDIEMPDGSGFRLLERVKTINFEVIFTTAFEQFAIKAIRYAALDYLLKPIVPAELVAAVEKVRQLKQTKTTRKQIEVLLDNINPDQLVPKKIVLSTSEKIHIVVLDDIIRCESDNYYTHFYFVDGGHLLISKTLKEIESILREGNFIRPHKSHLINTRYIKNFNRDQVALLLSDGSMIPVSRRKKEIILEIINQL